MRVIHCCCCCLDSLLLGDLPGHCSHTGSGFWRWWWVPTAEFHRDTDKPPFLLSLVDVPAHLLKISFWGAEHLISGQIHGKKRNTKKRSNISFWIQIVRSRYSLQLGNKLSWFPVPSTGPKSLAPHTHPHTPTPPHTQGIDSELGGWGSQEALIKYSWEKSGLFGAGR